ncbi:MAG: hypothetical protein J7623_13245 [Chitinophaga sp.]|uniref:hypothetical protein n=1 Tax=Chitinophaga sp. TaxID=1869181 RepID=UPI001B1ACA75|nr:hypothetical protein [Chitinophaga sp.]MBO9729597.1 hypothetical protein [Chitinophaga sp.]
MQHLFQTLLILHIIGGTLALITGSFASLTKKGGRAHRLNGKLFTVGMTIVFITAVGMALLKSLTFLLMVGFFSYHQLLRGYRALYLKKLYQGLRMGWPDYLINGIGGAFNLWLTVWGVVVIISQHATLGYVAILFGGIGLQSVVRDVRKFYVSPKEKQDWFFTHISGMSAAYIATVTAFLVVNVHFLPGLIVWTAPAIVGLVVINITIRKYRKQFAPKKVTEAV